MKTLIKCNMSMKPNLEQPIPVKELKETINQIYNSPKYDVITCKFI